MGFPSLNRSYTGALSSLAGSMPEPMLVPASVPLVDDGTCVFKFGGVASACTSSWPSTAVTLRGIVLIKLETDPFFAVYRPAAEGRSAPAESPDPNDFTVQYKDADGDLADMTPSSDIKYVEDWCRPRRTLLPAWSFLETQGRARRDSLDF